MFTTELHAVLVSLCNGVRCTDVLVRFECDNLETVYITVDGDGLLATDQGETFAYLQGAVPVPRARDICSAFGVEVDGSDPELYPRIQMRLRNGDEVQAG